jgi:hypothetical protein
MTEAIYNSYLIPLSTPVQINNSGLRPGPGATLPRRDYRDKATPTLSISGNLIEP